PRRPEATSGNEARGDSDITVHPALRGPRPHGTRQDDLLDKRDVPVADEEENREGSRQARDQGPRRGGERLLPEACRSRRGDEEEGRGLRATASKKYASRYAITYNALRLRALRLQLFAPP